MDALTRARDLVAEAAELIEDCGDGEYQRRHGVDFERLLSGLSGSVDELAGKEWFQSHKADGSCEVAFGF